MLDRASYHASALRAERSAALPVESMVVGLAPEEASELLPRIFNLCRAAQGIAARLVFGLKLQDGAEEALRQEILREHLIKYCLKLPGHFGVAPVRLPEGWNVGSDAARHALFGAAGVMPETYAGFLRFLETQDGMSAVLRRVRDCFAPGEACCGALPSVTSANALSATELENSVAGRQSGRPVMLAIETEFGRGPLWRATARLYDAQDCMNGLLETPVSPKPGVAVVPAARGIYALTASVENGCVSAFRRITPTDHLVAQGGILDQTLASLPAKKSGMASLLMDILDPCMPVRLREVRDA